MFHFTRYLLWLGLFCGLLFVDRGWAQSQLDTQFQLQFEVSEELTTIFRAARKVISVNQNIINDASIGDKGLSPAAVVYQLKVHFKAATGQALVVNSAAKEAMLQAVSVVIRDNQGLINEKGIEFKGFLPATFARQVANKFTLLMSGRMKIKLTAPKKYLRNRANKPDKWESDVIETLFSMDNYEKGRPFSQKVDRQGKDVFRFILPEYYDQSCLACHGEPKGQRDTTGGKKEGGELNELGGAISLTIYSR